VSVVLPATMAKEGGVKQRKDLLNCIDVLDSGRMVNKGKRGATTSMLKG